MCRSNIWLRRIFLSTMSGTEALGHNCIMPKPATAYVGNLLISALWLST